MREGQKRGKDLGLSDNEVAFCDALEVNDSAVKELGDPTLKQIAQELVARVQSVTIDWTLRENARAQIRVLVRRILRKHGYPPDKQEKATQTVLEQTELLGAEWAGCLTLYKNQVCCRRHRLGQTLVRNNLFFHPSFLRARQRLSPDCNFAVEWQKSIIRPSKHRPKIL
jgi:Domain of unknown function (DUF3387)